MKVENEEKKRKKEKERKKRKKRKKERKKRKKRKKRKDVFKEDAPIFKLLSVDDVGLEEEKVGLAGSPTIVASAPKVEKATRDLQITDVDGLQSIVEGWE